MNAAVVTAAGAPPTYQDYREPQAGEADEVITVRAAALSPIVKALASGTHYSAAAMTGFMPGVDGVGIDRAGRRVYFLFPKAPFGSLAERSLVAREMIVPVPAALPDELAAAIATGGLASWTALTRRAKLVAGETVLVLGATGAAGSMALQIARHLGARKLVAVGRDAARLAALPADVHIPLDERADAALREQLDAGVDVVLDFVWGEPARRVLHAVTHARGSRSGEPRLRYVQLGTVAGAELAIRGDMLRSSGLELLGSGIGSVSVRELVAGAGELLAAAPAAGFHAPFTRAPLRAIADVWSGDPRIRYVVTPSER